MKKIIGIILVIITFFAFSNSSFGQEPDCDDCPPGYTHFVKNFPNFPGGPIDVDFCVDCSPTNPYMDIVVYVNCIRGYTGADITDAIDYIQARIGPSYSEFCTGAWIPCSQGTVTMESWMPLCFYEDDQTPNTYHFCNSSYCVHSYEVCTDEYGNVVSTPTGVRVEGTLGCSDKLWYEAVPGECFRTEYCD